jgi:hypothetical protein
MNPIIDWREHAGSKAEKFYKSTLWQGEHVMLGINCLFAIEEREEDAGTGMLVLAPAGVSHGVTNPGNERLSLLVGIAPGIGK